MSIFTRKDHDEPEQAGREHAGHRDEQAGTFRPDVPPDEQVVDRGDRAGDHRDERAQAGDHPDALRPDDRDRAGEERSAAGRASAEGLTAAPDEVRDRPAGAYPEETGRGQARDASTADPAHEPWARESRHADESWAGAGATAHDPGADPGRAAGSTAGGRAATSGAAGTATADQAATSGSGTATADQATTSGSGTATTGQAGTAATGPTAAEQAASAAGDGQPERLVPRDRADAYTARWDSVKSAFVDDPRDAVAKADGLVGELLDELQQLFADQRRKLEQGLDADTTSTEDLRLALRRYRSFFDRLVSF